VTIIFSPFPLDANTVRFRTGYTSQLSRFLSEGRRGNGEQAAERGDGDARERVFITGPQYSCLRADRGRFDEPTPSCVKA